MRKKGEIKKILIEGMRKMNGEKKWELAAQKAVMVRELFEAGRRYYESKGFNRADG